ncbi:hypothetical protein CHK_1404 [Christensenella hongkongensis]|uniref:Uncharacterized protein n=1 Tax=Christensenella hongkongensis TaxID=270498 RepID=A0A0M2NKQ8_9FIRM|nr:hypothetical protein CHK_1404 [Christensenella hongkongensis]
MIKRMANKRREEGFAFYITKNADDFIRVFDYHFLFFL